MQDLAQSVFSPWGGYYVIVGSSGAALTGLQFVVMTLAAETRRVDGGAIDAYATPTVVHFCVALFVSAVLSAPWHALAGAALALGACAVFGMGYVLLVTRRATRQTGYKPVFEDWLWHTILPFPAYLTMLIAALEFVRHPETALFAVAAAVLLLLFVGIHNAWDTVTFLTVSQMGSRDRGDAGVVELPAAAERPKEPVS
jgi:hypothetical protein